MRSAAFLVVLFAVNEEAEWSVGRKLTLCGVVVHFHAERPVVCPNFEPRIPFRKVIGVHDVARALMWMMYHGPRHRMQEGCKKEGGTQKLGIWAALICG